MTIGEFAKKVKDLYKEVDGKKEMFVDLRTKDGEIVRVEDKNEPEEGDKLMRVTEEGVEPAPDGDYIIDDGRTVTVSEGAISKIGSSEEEEGSEEMNSEEDNSSNETSEEGSLSNDNGSEEVATAEAEEETSNENSEETSNEENENSSDLETRIDELEKILKEMKENFDKVTNLEEKVEKLSKEPAKPKQKKEEKFYGGVKEKKKNERNKAAELIAKARSK